MSLRDELDQDIKNNFLNTDDLGETISYTPFGGVAKSIDVKWKNNVQVINQITGEVSTFAASFDAANSDLTGQVMSGGVVKDSQAYIINRIDPRQTLPMTTCFLMKV